MTDPSAKAGARAWARRAKNPYHAPMNLITELPLRISDELVRAVVEVPRGSSLKLKYDGELGVFVWSRALSAGVSFPYDYGFLPQTLSGDDGALDAVVLAEVGAYPGVVVPARVIGALRLSQQREGQPRKRNDRILVVPANEHRYAHVRSASDLPERTREELQAFFTASLLMTGKQVEFEGFAEAKEAQELVAAGEARFRATR